MTAYYDLLVLNARQLLLIVPELLVMAGFLIGVTLDCVLPEERRKVTAYVCLVFLVGALFATVVDWNAMVHERPHTARAIVERPLPVLEKEFPGETTFHAYEAAHSPVLRSTPIFSGMIVRDGFGLFFKVILVIGTVVSVLTALHARELNGPSRGEFYLLLTATCLGGMFLAEASNLLMVYLSIESLSLLSYAMAGYLRQDRKSAEAGIKYVIYGAMASGVMIFGMSYLYGLTGSLNLTGPEGVTAQYHRLRESAAPGMHGAYLALVAMVLVGLLYKIAAAPFHYWSPDVYEGAPTTATGFFSVVPKAAGFAVLVRVLAEFFPFSYSQEFVGYGLSKMELAVAAVAVVTMFVGNMAALAQTNAKRMLAYSSIAHAGYMLAGLSALDDTKGAAAVMYYLLVYLFMNLGAFVVLVALENIRGSCELKDLKGVIRREPLLGVALVIFLFSLTGLPPLAGFTGKYLIMLKLADRANWFMILFIGVNSVVSLYYYMRLAKAVAIDAPEAVPSAGEPAPMVFNLIAAGKCAALVILFVFFKPVLDICELVLEPLAR